MAFFPSRKLWGTSGFMLMRKIVSLFNAFGPPAANGGTPLSAPRPLNLLVKIGSLNENTEETRETLFMRL